MKVIFLILVASSAYVNGQFMFTGKFKGQASLKKQESGDPIQDIEGTIQGQLSSEDLKKFLQNVQPNGLDISQPIQGGFNSLEIQNNPQGFLNGFENGFQNNFLPNAPLPIIRAEQPISIPNEVSSFPGFSTFPGFSSFPSSVAPPVVLPDVSQIPVQQPPVSSNSVVPETSNIPVSPIQPSEPTVVAPVANDVEDTETIAHIPEKEVTENVAPTEQPEVSEKPVEIDAEWEAFKAKYGKVYTLATEDAYRKQLYYANKGKIENFNTNAAADFDLGMNQFGDFTLDEFTKSNGLTLSAKQNNGSSYIPSVFVAKPNLVDWRNYTGAVTEVKDQGNCYSCWAFTAAAVLESHWWRKTGETVDISEQNILDCRTDDEKDSCAPGYYTTAWEYIMDNNGVDGEQIYPYESYNNDNFTCRFKPEGVVARVTGIVELPEKDEEAMELAIATQGPLAAAIDANTLTQQFYSDGVFRGLGKDNSGTGLETQCTENVNHAVTIVGFGEENNQKYWLIKNSYGTSWGQNGYMKLARGENMCGISLNPAYPLV